MKNVCGIILLLPALLLSNLLAGQYILNGSAVQNTCNCYTLTPEVNTQSGSVWNANKINLNNPFDFIFNVNLGCKDANGADGIVFILQPISTSVGTTGGGMGFQGVSPSIGIALDTWQNTQFNDPIFDHISIQANGNLDHASDLSGTPVQASSTDPNIEDCQWHTFRIVWNPTTKLLQTYFDGVFRAQATVDMIVNIFNNDPMVYWGFSAGTGGSNNLQQFCTALNPKFNTNSTNDAVCLGTPVSFTNTSESFAPIANFFWDFGDGNNSIAATPPPHLYAAPGIYTVKLAITGLDGCRSDTLRKTVVVGDFPIANFDVYDTCAGFIPRIVDRSQVTVGTVSQWNWKLGGTTVSTAQNPQLTGLAPGTYQLELVTTSIYGCSSAPVVKQLIIKPRPTIDATVINGCVNEQLSFTGQQIDNATTITQWNWAFGDAQTSNQQNPQHTYTSANGYTITLTADASNGCSSQPITKQVIINARPVITANTTDGCVSTQLSFTAQQIDNATLINQWAWDFGDGQTSNQQNPQHTYTNPGTFTVTVVATSDKGCGSAVITKQVVVHPKPVINSTVMNGCANEQLSFSAQQIDNSTTITQWNWAFGDLQSSNQQNPQHTYSNAGTYTVTVAATSDKGCTVTDSKQVVVNPKPVIDAVVTTGCINEIVNFTGQQIDNATTITQWNWAFGDGQISNQQNPQHTYSTAGTYTVTLTANGNNGCNSAVTTKQVIIYTKPVITAVMPAGCMNTALSFTAQQTDNATTITQWNWNFGDGQTSNQQNPQHTYTGSGTYTVTVTAISDKGCSSLIVSNQVAVNPKPIINASANNGCINEPVSFSAQQIDNATNITQWNWTFGDGQTSNQQNPQHTYNSKATYNVTVTAMADNGCSSAVITIPLFINQAVANAGKDTIAIKDEPMQLQGTGGVTYNWSPATGLNDATLQNPVATLQDDITYTLTITTAEGCEDTDEIKITVFKSSAIYVPTGFTPNGDGLNDLMRPYCAGIKKLDYFTVYNRWGQMIFTTKTIGDGWDGVFKGSKQSTGTYIWTLRAVDYAGKIFQLKGMTTLLR